MDQGTCKSLNMTFSSNQNQSPQSHGPVYQYSGQMKRAVQYRAWAVFNGPQRVIFLLLMTDVVVVQCKEQASTSDLV